MTTVFSTSNVPARRLKPRAVESFMARETLLKAFANRRPVTIPDSTKGGNWTVCGVINTLQHEDGSGYSYLVTLSQQPGVRYYVRTI
jgi:hypothetical protein